MKGSIETRVKAVVARHFNLPPSKVRLDAAFVGDLGGDALDLIELGYQLEAAFNVRLSPSQRDTLTTPRAVVDFFRKVWGQTLEPQINLKLTSSEPQEILSFA